MQPFHLLALPSWYPSKEVPHLGCFFAEQLQQLQRSGVQVGVIHPEIRPLKALRWAMAKNNHFQLSHSLDFGIPTWRLHGWNLSPLWERGQMIEWIASCRKLMRRYIATHGRPQIIHAHSLLWGGAAAAALSKHYGIPYIITEHNTNFLEDRPLSRPLAECWSYRPLKKIAAHAAFVTGVSTPLCNKLALYGVEPDRLRMIPNMVKMSSFGLPEKKPPLLPFRFFSLGGLVKRKNFALLIQAFDRAFHGSEQVELVIGGSGPEEQALRQQVARLGLGSVVSFVGELKRHEVEQQMHGSHAFVLASDYETFGVVLVEALACGLPVISTNSGGPVDIIHEGVGLLVEKGSMYQLSEAMINLRRDYGNYSPKSIRHDAERRFGQQAFTRQWAELYARTLG